MKKAKAKRAAKKAKKANRRAQIDRIEKMLMELKAAVNAITPQPLKGAV